MGKRQGRLVAMASKYQENLKRFPGVPSAYWPKEGEGSIIKPLTDEQIKKREEMLASLPQLDDIKKRK